LKEAIRTENGLLVTSRSGFGQQLQEPVQFKGLDEERERPEPETGFAIIGVIGRRENERRQISGPVLPAQLG
jgi:hypothetical protein